MLKFIDNFFEFLFTNKWALRYMIFVALPLGTWKIFELLLSIF
jgi:hypothetical protein